MEAQGVLCAIRSMSYRFAFEQSRIKMRAWYKHICSTRVYSRNVSTVNVCTQQTCTVGECLQNRQVRVSAVHVCSCKANARVKTRKDGARPALFLIFVFYVFFVLFYVFLRCSMYCLFCVVLCIVCVYMCTELLPSGGYPNAVKYISYIITGTYTVNGA